MSSFDRPLAAFIFCASSIVSALSYQTLERLEHPQEYMIANVPEGSARFEVRTKDGCVGAFHSALTHEGTAHLNIGGGAAFRSGKAVVNARISFDALFNPLGQLTAGALFIDFGGSDIKITARDPNPITLKLEVRSPGRDLSLPFQIQGPLQLSSTGKDAARLEYAAATSPNQNYLMVFTKPLEQYLSNIGPHVERLSGDNQAPSACEKSPDAALDISALARLGEIISDAEVTRQFLPSTKEHSP
jgi:hypothetical protein